MRRTFSVKFQAFVQKERSVAFPYLSKNVKQEIEFELNFEFFKGLKVF